MKRAVRSLIRIIAAGLIGFGIIELVFEIVSQRAKGTAINAWHLIIGSLLIVLGIVMFVTSTRLAKKLTADFDE